VEATPRSRNRTSSRHRTWGRALNPLV
jgi:hypothetical protein